MITDMHDGRKKVFFEAGFHRLILKVGVMFGGYKRHAAAAMLNFLVTHHAAQKTYEPLETWSEESGWERLYFLDQSTNFWLSFRHPHHEQAGSACIHFGLFLQTISVDAMQFMLQCNSDAKIYEEFFRLDATDMPQHTEYNYEAKPGLVRQSQIGFLQKISFNVAVSSWMQVAVGFNFILSHAEMDLVNTKYRRRVAYADLHYMNSADSQINARQVLIRQLLPGSYTLRLADDHYKDQVNGEACFPFSFNFRVIPEEMAPSLLYVQPDPSVPLLRSVDMVVFLHFSEAPRGKTGDVVKSIALESGPDAILSSVSADELVWEVRWMSKELVSRTTAKVIFRNLVANTSGIQFVAPSREYSLVDVLPEPWAGGQAALVDRQSSWLNPSSDGRSNQVEVVGDYSQQPRSPGEVGQVRTEGSRIGTGGQLLSELQPTPPPYQAQFVPPAPPPPPQVLQKVEVGINSYNEKWWERDIKKTNDNQWWDSGVENTQPPPATANCPEGTALNEATGICDLGWMGQLQSTLGSSQLGANQSTLVIGAVVMLMGMWYVWPQVLQWWVNRPGASRFSDIGVRSKEEEMSLFSGPDDDDDDDML